MLAIHRVERQQGERILEGALLCGEPECQSEYPIIDGIPILVADLRNWVKHNVDAILQRSDLSANTESLIGDCCGPGSGFDAIRQNLSTYAADHYGDLVSGGDANSRRPSSVVELLRAGVNLCDAPIAGPVLDAGCSVGRTSFELADKSEGLVLGVDLNFSMLQLASRMLHEGRLQFPRRRQGLVYERQAVQAAFEQRDKVDFWLCDASALPFGDGRFGAAVSLNLLDCINSPYEHLLELDRLIRPDGQAMVAAPYDWSANATPVEAWIGGHSQRGPEFGASEPLLRSLFTPGHPRALKHLRLRAEIADHPWRLRLHDRSEMHYRVHLMALESRPDEKI